MKSGSRREFMAAAGRYALYGFGVAPLFSAVISGCEGMEEAATIGASLGQATGVITDQQAESIIKSGQAVARGFEDITPEQEYYIGRAVGASLLDQYPPYENRDANLYVNTMGQALAQVSDLPETFNGYHFLILDTNEINAFAAPGGLIFVSRGMLRCCRTEDAVAAVLAHEIGHYQKKHIIKSMIISIFHLGVMFYLLSIFITSGELAQAFYMETPSSYAGLVFFGMLYTPVEMILSIFMQIFSRKNEYEADRFAAESIDNPEEMVNSLKKLSADNLSNLTPHPFYVFLHYSHPPVLQRIQAIRTLEVGSLGDR